MCGINVTAYAMVKSAADGARRMSTAASRLLFAAVAVLAAVASRHVDA